MDPRQKEIASLEREIKDLDEQLQNECVDIGTRLQGFPGDSLKGEALTKYVRNMEALVASQEELNAQIERIHRLGRDVEARTREMAEVEEKTQTLSEEYDKIAFDVGAAAYSAMKKVEDPTSYRAHYGEIIKIDEEIDRLEKQLKAAEEEDKSRGFFGRLVSRGRSLGVRSAINKQGKLKLEKFAASGKAIAETDLAERVGGELKALFESIAVRRREFEEAGERRRVLEDEREKLNSELRILGALEEPDAKIREIESRVAETNRELALVRLWAGQAFVDQNSEAVGDAMLKGKATLASSLRGVIEEKRDRIARHKAAIELESLKERSRSLARKREQLESEIRTRQDQIGSLSDEIGSVEKRIEELAKLLDS